MAREFKLTPTVNGIPLLRAKLIRKTADETVNNSTALQDDDHLILPVLAGEKYFFQAALQIRTGDTPDLKIGWSVPAGTTMKWQRWANLGGVVVASSATTLQSESSTVNFGGLAGNDFGVTLGGWIFVSSTAGNVTIRWAQNTADASDSIIRADSFLMAIPLL